MIEYNEPTLIDAVDTRLPQIVIHFETDSEREQLFVLLQAAAIYSVRNEMYNDNWQRQGWRGCMFKLRLKVERVWEAWWNAEPAPQYPNKDVDDLLDAINCAAFAVRAIRTNNRDGSWTY